MQKDKSVSMKTCPVAAENNKENLLLEKMTFSLFKVQWLHFAG